MQPPALWTDRLLSDRSTTLFRALYARELGFDEYARVMEEVLDPEMVFFLRNSYRSLAYMDGGD